MRLPRRPRRPLPALPALLAASLVTAALPALGVVGAAPASAAVTAPANGATVSGNVAISETGATNTCTLGQGSPSSRVAVTRVADGAVVHTDSRSGAGTLSTTWASLGQPRGTFRIQSWARSSVRSGFLNLGCTNQGEVAVSSFTVTLDNRAAVAVELPSSVVTGETLPVTVRTSVVGTGVTGQALGGRTVTVTVPGVGSDEVVTGANGVGSTSFDLPDLAAGPLAVSAEVTPDASYSSAGSSSSTTTLAKRTTQTLYRGDSRGEPGTRARLEALLVDATPGSARYGEPVVGEPVSLALGDDVAEVETVASGRAVRTAAVDGPSRTVPAAAAYAGDDVRLPSGDGVTFFVGDDAAAPAPVQSGLVGSTTTALTGLLGQLLGGLPVTVQTDLPLVGTLVGTAGLQNLLDTLLVPVTPALTGVGGAADDALGTILDGLEGTSPLGDVVKTARFEWRASYVAPDGTRRNREFNAVIGVPQPLDVTGDGRSDVLANVTLARITPDAVVPRLEVARIGDLSAPLPLSLQAVIDLPGSDDDYRFGYDARQGSAPKTFTADVQLGDGGAVLEVGAEGDDRLTVSGAIAPGGDDASPAEQRFGVTFSDAPSAARLGLALGGDAQDIAATLATDTPTKVELSLVDDGGADEVFLADATLDQVDGDVSLVVSGAESTGLTADLTGDGGLDQVSLRARSLDAGRTVSDVRLALTDVPDVVSFGLTADGAGELTASGPIGVFEAGYASGRDLALLDDAAYLRLLQDGDTQSIALRLPGFEGMEVSLADELSLALTMAPTPLRALVDQDGRTFDARIVDAPHQVKVALSPDGSVTVEGSDPIAEVTLAAHDDAGILSGATDLDLRLVDVPGLLTVGVEDDGVVFDTAGRPIGLLEVFADNGTHLAVPGGGDGLLVRTTSDGGTALAGRISGLRRIEASLGDQPDVLLDTVAGSVFTITLQDEGNDDVRATLDHLVPNMRLGLLDDGSGATRLTYSADEATRSLSFDMGGLSGSIAGPLPKQLLVCMAGDEACLPDLGIEDPDLGSVRFAASETTTLNLVDSGGGLNATDLRLQVLDLTGSMDIDNGGDVYLNTTEFGDDFGNGCGTAGCVRPVQGGRVNVDLGSAGLLFEPGNGFFARSALTHLKVRKLFGQPIGLDGTGGTGVVNCVGATKLDVTVFDIPVLGDITLSVKDALCNVNRTG